MMRLNAAVTLAILALSPSVARAQDTLPAPVRAQRLRQMIEARFGERLKEELGLTDDQAAKLKVSLATVASRRRAMEADERTMRQALASQLRPGVAANADSVGRLVESLTNHRIAYAQTFKDELRDLSTILTPVQRGQYLMLRDRLMQRAQDLRQGRAGPPGPGAMGQGMNRRRPVPPRP
jgi:hypothetical protein